MPITPLGLTASLTPPLLTALHLAPLLSSTASLTHAYMEYITTSAFLSPAPLDSSISKGILGRQTPYPHGRRRIRTPRSTPTPDEPQSEQEEEEKKAKEIVIPAWFTTFFNTGVYSVIGLNTITLLSSLANVYYCAPAVLRTVPGGSSSGAARARSWYKVGALAALAHYAFVPLVGGSVKALVELCAKRVGGEREEGEEGGKEGKEEKSAGEWLREWVGWHCVRMGTVDVVAWVCLFVGAVEMVGVRVDVE